LERSKAERNTDRQALKSGETVHIGGYAFRWIADRERVQGAPRMHLVPD
jgi:hypothetical protein